MYLIGFPLLVITFAIYNMIAFLMPSLTWTASVMTIHLISGQDWTVTPEDIILAFAILLLGVEVVKAARMGVRGLMDHILSMILFIVMLVEFLLVAARRDVHVLHSDGDHPRRRDGGLHHHRADSATGYPDRSDDRPRRLSVAPQPVQP